MNFNNLILILGISLIAVYSFQLVPSCIDIPVEELTTEQPDTVFTKSDLVAIYNKLKDNGYLIIQTFGDSMKGTIETNQRCLCIPQDSYQVGDIVLFIQDGTGIAHEIISYTQNSYITKGTNNDFADGEVLPREILCKIPEVRRYELW